MHEFKLDDSNKLIRVVSCINRKRFEMWTENADLALLIPIFSSIDKESANQLYELMI